MAVAVKKFPLLWFKVGQWHSMRSMCLFLFCEVSLIMWRQNGTRKNYLTWFVAGNNIGLQLRPFKPGIYEWSLAGWLVEKRLSRRLNGSLLSRAGDLGEFKHLTEAKCLTTEYQHWPLVSSTRGRLCYEGWVLSAGSSAVAGLECGGHQTFNLHAFKGKTRKKKNLNIAVVVACHLLVYSTELQYQGYLQES